MLRKALSSLFQKEAQPATRASSGMVAPEPRAPFPDAGPAARVTLYVEGWCSDSRKAERLCVERGWPTHREALDGRHADKVALQPYQVRAQFGSRESYLAQAREFH